MAKTLLDIDADLLDSVKRLAKAKTKREAVEIALRQFVRSRHARLAEAAGTSSMRWTPADIRAMRANR